MKRKFLCFLSAFVLAAALLLTGCGQEQKAEKGIIGTWKANSLAFVAAQSDSEAQYYYTFEEGGKIKITTGTLSFVGSWSYTDKDGEEADIFNTKVKIEVQTIMSGTYKAKLKARGGDEYTLTLTDDKKASINLKSTELPQSPIVVSDDFKEVEFITGKWQAKDSDDVFYTFNSDGSCLIEQSSIEICGTYVVDENNSIITLTYIEQEQSEFNIPYLIKDGYTGKEITFSNAVFTKVE